MANTLEWMIEQAALGNPSKQRPKGMGFFKNYKTHGSLEFYINDVLVEQREIIKTAGRRYRNKLMNEITKKAKHIKGDKYFMWKPEN